MPSGSVDVHQLICAFDLENSGKTGGFGPIAVSRLDNETISYARVVDPLLRPSGSTGLDGNALAYALDRRGENELLVRRFPVTDTLGRHNVLSHALYCAPGTLGPVVALGLDRAGWPDTDGRLAEERAGAGSLRQLAPLDPAALRELGHEGARALRDESRSQQVRSVLIRLVGSLLAEPDQSLSVLESMLPGGSRAVLLGVLDVLRPLVPGRWTFSTAEVKESDAHQLIVMPSYSVTGFGRLRLLADQPAAEGDAFGLAAVLVDRYQAVGMLGLAPVHQNSTRWLAMDRVRRVRLMLEESPHWPAANPPLALTAGTGTGSDASTGTGTGSGTASENGQAAGSDGVESWLEAGRQTTAHGQETRSGGEELTHLVFDQDAPSGGGAMGTSAGTTTTAGAPAGSGAVQQGSAGTGYGAGTHSGAAQGGTHSTAPGFTGAAGARAQDGWQTKSSSGPSTSSTGRLPGRAHDGSPVLSPVGAVEAALLLRPTAEAEAMLVELERVARFWTFEDTVGAALQAIHDGLAVRNPQRAVPAGYAVPPDHPLRLYRALVSPVLSDHQVARAWGRFVAYMGAKLPAELRPVMGEMAMELGRGREFSPAFKEETYGFTLRVTLAVLAKEPTAAAGHRLKGPRLGAAEPMAVREKVFLGVVVGLVVLAVVLLLTSI